jgi:hypothetical protein
MIVTLALTFSVKALLLLIAAIILGIVAVVLLLPPRNASEWTRGLGYAALCLAMIAWFIWAAGG